MDSKISAVTAAARSRLSFANAVSVLALFVALGGSAYAAVTITGKNVKNGSLTGIDIRDGSLLAVDFKRGQLPSGKTGPAGPSGPAGASGRDASYVWAQVSATGSLTGGAGATSASRTSTGNYSVRFNRSVVGCAALATITNNVGQINAVPGSGGADTVYVGVNGSSGSSGADQAFFVAALC